MAEQTTARCEPVAPEKTKNRDQTLRDLHKDIRIDLHRNHNRNLTRSSSQKYRPYVHCHRSNKRPNSQAHFKPAVR